MTTPTIHAFNDANGAAQALAETLATEELDGAADILLLLSGGSALVILGSLPDLDDATFLTISVIDERDEQFPRARTDTMVSRNDLPRRLVH